MATPCQLGVMASHLWAIPVIGYLQDPWLRVLLLTYVLNDIQVHLGPVPSTFNYWGRAVVISIFLYLTARFFGYFQSNWRWWTGLAVFVGWGIVELLYSQSFGWYPNRPGVSPDQQLCYETIIHTVVWLSIWAWLWLVPCLR